MAKREKRKKKNARAIFKLIVVLLFLVAIISVFSIASNNFARNDIKGKTNLIINNSNVTDSLKHDVYLENGVIYISKEDVEGLFDNTIIYDETYNQIITCSDKKVASLPIEENKIKVNGSTVKIAGHALHKNSTYYIPFSELEDVYNVKVAYVQGTDIVTVDSLDSEYKIATASKDIRIKYKPTSISRSVAKVKQGEILTIANHSDFPVPDSWARVRTSEGILGYAKINTMGEWNTIRENIEKQKTQGQNGAILECYIPSNNKTNTEISSDITLEMLRDYEQREEIINEIIDCIIINKLGGVNVTFESAQEDDKNYFSRFIIELEPRLNEIGLSLSVDGLNT